MKRSLICVVAVLVMAAVSAVCGASAPGPTAWLDRPLDGSSLPFSPSTGPVIVQAHASDADGVAAIEFFVDDESLGSVPGGGGRLGEASVEWNPTAAGTYTVRARATDSEGNVGPEDSSVVVVGELTPASPTATIVIPSPTATIAVPTPTETPVVPTPTATIASPAPTATLSPTPTLVVPTRTASPTLPKPTATEPAPDELRISFTADMIRMRSGECATLAWSVRGAEAAFLNGEPVRYSGEKQVCPRETTTYSLAAYVGVGPPDPPVAERQLVIVVFDMPEVIPTPTSTRTIGTVLGEVRISLTTDRTRLQAGECATLTWNVQGGYGVELNGQPVQRSGAQQVCPAETTSYKLAVDAGDRMESEEILVTVAPAAPPSPTPTQLPGPVPQPPVPPRGGADVRPSDLFPQGGSVWTRITNDGHDTLASNRVEVTISGCGAGKQFALSIAPGQTQTIDTGCQAAAGSHSYTVSVRAIDFTDPNPANNTYSETLSWGGAAPPPPAPPAPAQPSTLDLAITDLFPKTLHGPVYGRITNRGPGSASNLTVQFSCRRVEIDAIEGTRKTDQIGPRNITITNLSPGQTTEFNTNLSVELQQYQYDVSCTLHGPANDPNTANNSYSEKISR